MGKTVIKLVEKVAVVNDAMINDDEIIKVYFGEEGYEYFNQQFTNEKTKLSRLVEHRSHDILDTFSFLPKNFSQQAIDAENYRWSLGMSLENSPTRPPLVDFIRDYIKAAPENVCVMENADFRKEDPKDSRLKSRMFFHESNVFHISLPGDSPEQIDYELLVSGRIRCFLAMLTSPNEHFAAHPEGGVDFSHLDVLVQNAKFLITTAWDEEGYLIAQLRDE